MSQKQRQGAREATLLQAVKILEEADQKCSMNEKVSFLLEKSMKHGTHVSTLLHLRVLLVIREDLSFREVYSRLFEGMITGREITKKFARYNFPLMPAEVEIAAELARNIGRLAHGRGNLREAKRAFAAARMLLNRRETGIDVDHDLRYAQAEESCRLGDDYLAVGKLTEAWNCYRAALKFGPSIRLVAGIEKVLLPFLKRSNKHLFRTASGRLERIRQKLRPENDIGSYRASMFANGELARRTPIDQFTARSVGWREGVRRVP